MSPDTGGEISVAIPVIFTLLLVFLFLFLFTTRNFSLKRTFTPVAIFLFSLYTVTVIGLWFCFLTAGFHTQEEFSDRGKSFFQPSSNSDPEPFPAASSDKIILHNETYPVSPRLSSHAPEEATPIPDFNYRQEIVPRTIAERLRHFRQILNMEKQRRNLLEKESKQTKLDFPRMENIQKEFRFLQIKHDRFLAPLLRNLELSAKQRELRDAARTKTYDKELTDYLRQRIETFLAEHNTRNYTPEDHEIVNGFIHEIQNTRIDPNMTITDRAHPVYSGPLLKAALEGRFPRTSELILSLLRKNADVNVEVSAITVSNLPFFLQYTMPNGLENVDTCQGKNILLSMAKDPSVAPRELLLPLLFGADVLPVDEVGRTALHYIAMRGEALALIQYLIYSGAEVNAMDRDGFTPLMLAYFSTNPNSVQEMEAFSPDPNIINRFGAKAKDYEPQQKLIQAVVNNHPAEARKALEKGADPYQVLSMRLNLFQLACFHEAEETVEILLKNGVNPNILPEYETSLGRLPLHIVFKKNNLRLFERLLKQNANYKEQELCIHRRPHPLIHTVCETPAGKPFLKLLLEAGADINSRSRKLETPLMKAVYLEQNEEIIRFLLENGADVNAQDAEGKTALMKAALYGQENHVRRLLDAGADPLIKSKSGKTAKDFTAKQSIRDLLDHRARKKQN